jgi:hypothetical protein
MLNKEEEPVKKRSIYAGSDIFTEDDVVNLPTNSTKTIVQEQVVSHKTKEVFLEKPVERPVYTAPEVVEEVEEEVPEVRQK